MKGTPSGFPAGTHIIALNPHIIKTIRCNIPHKDLGSVLCILDFFTVQTEYQKPILSWEEQLRLPEPFTIFLHQIVRKVSEIIRTYAAYEEVSANGAVLIDHAVHQPVSF